MPVIVGGIDGRGVVCAASYEARLFGVHSAMPMVTTRRLCAHAVYLPVRMKHYAQISRQICDIFFSFTPLVEPLSLDEAFLDTRGSEGLFGPAPVWHLAHGQDDRTVVTDREAKSISTETTFACDIGDRHVLRTWLLDLVDHLAGRLRRQKLHARTIGLKIRSSDFRTRNRSQALAEASNQTEALWQSAVELFERALSREMLPVRLLGVGASRLTREGGVQGHFFDAGQRERRAALDRTIDAIRGQFGTGAIRRGSRLDRSSPEAGD